MNDAIASAQEKPTYSALVLTPPLVLPAEEGIRGWLCVLGSFLCIFCSFGFLSAMGVFQTHYEQTTLSEYSTSSITWIFAVQLALMWIPGPLFGRLIDTYGAAPVIFPCAALSVFALAMTSLAREYYQIFLAQGLAFGIGSGGMFTTSIVCVGQWFVRRRGLATGIASVGSSLGGVLFPIFFVRVSATVGFYGAIRYAALMNGILLVPSCFLVRARLPRKEWDSNVPWLDWTLFRQKQFAYLAVGAFLVMWGVWGPFNFISSMGLDAGFSETFAIYLISLVNATMIPGRILPSHWADRVGYFNVITVCCFLTAVSILALWLPFNYHHIRAGIIVFALVYGFVSGAFVSLLMPCVAKAGSLETLGQRFGTFQTVVGISCLTGLPIMGAILSDQDNRNYLGVQLFSGLCCLVGCGFLAVSTRCLSQAQKSWRV